MPRHKRNGRVPVKKLFLYFCVLGLVFGVYLFLTTKNEIGSVARSVDMGPSRAKGRVVGSLQTAAPAARSVASAQSTPLSVKTASNESQKAAPLSPADRAREEALVQLQNSSSEQWDVRRDNFSDQIRTLSDGVLGQVSAKDFVSQYSKSLFGVPSSHLFETRNETTDRTKIVYSQQVNGLPVYGGTLTLFYEGTALVRVQNDLSLNESVLGSGRLATVSDAFNFLQSSARLSASARGEAAPVLRSPALSSGAAAPVTSLVLYPSSSGLVHAYQFAVQEIRPGQKPESYLAIIDAQNLRLIAKKAYRFE